VAQTNYNPAEIIKQAQASLPKYSGKANEVVLRRNTDHPGQPFQADSSKTNGQGAAIAQKALDGYRTIHTPQEENRIAPAENTFEGLSSSKVTALPSHLQTGSRSRGNLRFFADNLSEVRNQLFKN